MKEKILCLFLFVFSGVAQYCHRSDFRICAVEGHLTPSCGENTLEKSNAETKYWLHYLEEMLK